MEKKTFKILSIDGGGIKGLYSAKILQKFEEKFNCRTSDHFDMICGTSTGGLIALALTSNISAEDICKFYEEKGEIIFPKNKIIRIPCLFEIDIGFLKQVLFSGKYSDKGLKASLREVFEEREIGDANNLLCIPTYSITEARPRVFKFDHKEGKLSRDNKIKMVDVALATTAAPTFFPMAEIEDFNNEHFIDGGVWANNPTLIGLLEALDYFVGPKKDYDKISILSLSSLTVTEGKPTGIKRERSFRHWKQDLFETSMNGQSSFTDFFLNKIKEISNTQIKYFRIPSTRIFTEQKGLIELDVANKQAYDLMKIKANDQALIYEKKEEIIEFFTTPKTYNTNG